MLFRQLPAEYTEINYGSPFKYLPIHDLPIILDTIILSVKKQSRTDIRSTRRRHFALRHQIGISYEILLTRMKRDKAKHQSKAKWIVLGESTVPSLFCLPQITNLQFKPDMYYERPASNICSNLRDKTLE
jgi:hypothetical protein